MWTTINRSSSDKDRVMHYAYNDSSLIVGLILCSFSKIIVLGSPLGPMTYIAMSFLLMIPIMDFISSNGP